MTTEGSPTMTTPEPLTPRDDRTRWTEPMTQAEMDALDGVYFYDDGYAAAEDVQRLLATIDALRTPTPTEPRQ